MVGFDRPLPVALHAMGVALADLVLTELGVIVGTSMMNIGV